ncbi:MAG: DsbA family oxidoreductase [Burkholderiales bacterium]
MGKRKLEKALAVWSEKHPGEPSPAVRWLPFQLNPDLPEAGIPRREYIERKWGPGRGPEVYSRVTAAGQAMGIPFAFENIAVQPNTLHAHRLLVYADQQGHQDAVAEALFEAYFIGGANLTDKHTLADVAAKAGLDRDAVLAYLESDHDRELVQQADIQARSAGIGGVPFFIFNRSIGVSGAQDPETLLDAMEQAIQARGSS